MSSIIGSFKNLVENPGDAQNIIESDSNFQTENFTDVNWYVGQTGLILQDVQTEIGTYVTDAVNLPASWAEPIGICIPAIILLLIAWSIIRMITKFFKAAIVISIIVFGVYFYMSMT